MMDSHMWRSAKLLEKEVWKTREKLCNSSGAEKQRKDKIFLLSLSYFLYFVQCPQQILLWQEVQADLWETQMRQSCATKPAIKSQH